MNCKKRRKALAAVSLVIGIVNFSIISHHGIHAWGLIGIAVGIAVGCLIGIARRRA